ncbi:MAG: alpha/beta fold hydrolase [Pseudolysinimonas sp.]
MTDSILTRPGAQLAYSISGDGPIVVSAHAMTMSRAVAAETGQGFARLAQCDRTVVEYDARGHGRSTGALVADDYTWQSLADDLLALMDEVSPDAPVDAIGASMGCATILHAVLRAPERFRRLVLVIPPTAWETRAAIASGYEQIARLVEQDGVDALIRLDATVPNPPAVPADLVLRTDISDELIPTVFRGAALSDLPPRVELASIAQPTLILAWVGDPGHPTSTSEGLLALLPHAGLRVAQSPEQVEEWVALADAFLGG